VSKLAREELKFAHRSRQANVAHAASGDHAFLTQSSALVFGPPCDGVLERGGRDTQDGLT
jgi:hypothetical protein